MQRTQHRLIFLAALAAVITAVACGGSEQKADTTPAAAPQQAPPTPGGPLSPASGGEIIKIDMITDEQGSNKFVPNKLEAHQGDVLRFTLVAGVHNAHFLPDSNPGMQGLPAASPLLQLPGQTYDIAVDFRPGHYYFQCDPHALLGMVGRLEVEERER
jgi:plastocyanin